MKDLIKDLKVVMVSGLDIDFKDKAMEKLITSYISENKAFSLQGVSQRSELSFLEGYEIKVYESEYIDKPQLLLPKGLVKKDCC